MPDQLETPYLTTEQMIELDRAMIEDYGIELMQMMENAGRGLARLVNDRFLDGSPADKRVAVLAGTGGNGGGALVAARRLSGWGAAVDVVTTKSADNYSGVLKHQLEIVDRLPIRRLTTEALESGESDYAVIVDGIIGYSLKGAPRGAALHLMEWCNRQASKRVSLDVPSGVDSRTGTTPGVAVKADATLTLALPKVGLRVAAPLVGELFLADISVPPQLYERMNLDVPRDLFAAGDIVEIT